jgi:hypothetical protein
MKDFDEEYYGWISPKSPPTNNCDVVILIYNTFQELHETKFGFYENKKWCFRNGDYTKDNHNHVHVKGWLNLPYYPKKS